MKSIWLKKKLSGKWNPPESVETEDDVFIKVSSTPGAIGFISLAKVTSEVKTLLLLQSREK